MANKRMQIGPLYVKDREIYAKDVGNGNGDQELHFAKG